MPLKALGLVFLAGAYARGMSVLVRGRQMSNTLRWRALAFVMGVAVLGTATVSPLDHQAEHFLWLHMVQHLLLVLLAPILLLLGRPGLPLLLAFPPSIRRKLGRLRHRPLTRRLLALATAPAVAWIVHVAILWAWHTPGLYDLAAAHEPIHIVEHSMFFAGALLFWGVLLHSFGGRRMTAGASLFYVFLAGIQSTALGALLTFAPSPLFPFYEARAGAGLTALEDQQLAGLIMWIPAGVIYVGAVACIFLSWMRGLDRQEPRTRTQRAVLPPLLLLLVFVGLAIAGPAQRAAPARAETLAQQGPPPQLYLSDCAYCHGTRGEGTHYGPELAGVGAASADFMLRSGRMPIESPDQYPKRAEPHYGEGDIVTLVNYIESLGDGPAIPQVDVTTGGIPEGQKLYIDNCAACHTTTGIGGVLTAEAVAPSLADATPTEIAEAMRIGGNGREGSMPVFGPATISQHDLDSIVRYVVYLQNPDDRGGAGLGHLGPISEGFVGWVVGLGLLILVIRWIGERGESAP